MLLVRHAFSSGNPRPNSMSSTPSNPSSATFSCKATLWRMAFAPFVGLIGGMLGSAVVGILSLSAYAQGITPLHLFEMLLAMPIMGLMAGVHGAPYAAVTGLVVMPLLPLLRRGKVLDALVVAILAGAASYFVAITGDESFGGMAEFHYLSPRIAASFAAAGACIYLLGRGDDRRFVAAISTSMMVPRRRGAAYWRTADRE